MDRSLSWDQVAKNLHPWLKDAIVALGYPAMTPVQASTIPLFSGNKDVVVQSVTGSGKTLAFTIPVLHHVSRAFYDSESPTSKKGLILAVIISPTRELAHQIQSVFDQLIQFLPDEEQKLKTQLVVGSLVSVREDIEAFTKDKPQIIIGTPGRLLEFVSNPRVKTNTVEIAVLDEADRLLDMSFENDVLSILRQLPKQRRTGLFSATLSASGDRIFKVGMLNPVKVAVQSKSSLTAAPSSLTIKYLMVSSEQQFTMLLQLIRRYKFKKCMVYFPTCISVKHFYQLLLVFEDDPSNPVRFHSLHGQLGTSTRLKTLKAFTEADSDIKKHVLMTTDVAARGIDVSDVDLVIQLDPPNDPDVFLHRAGRTGRANKAGNAIVMLSEGGSEINFVDFMEVKGVLMSELKMQPDSEFHQRYYARVRQFMLDDRARHETAVKAYVAFVKSYSKHLAKSIFRLQSLDYVGVALMYGLLRLPKMPEARYIPSERLPEDGWLIGEPMDMDKYKYADPVKERARVENLEADKEKKIQDAKKRKQLKKQNESWSSKEKSKEAKLERKQKLKRKREELERKLMEQSSDDEEVQVDWKDLVRQSKKLRQTSSVQGQFSDL